MTKIFDKSPLGMPRNSGLRRTRYVGGKVAGFGNHWVFALKVTRVSHLNALLSNYAKTFPDHPNPASGLAFLTFPLFFCFRALSMPPAPIRSL